jgi:hypothetical protein
MGVESVTREELLTELMDFVGCDAQPDPAERWVAWRDMVSEAKQRGKSVDQLRRMTGKRMAAGEIEKMRMGMDVYYRVRREDKP